MSGFLSVLIVHIKLAISIILDKNRIFNDLLRFVKLQNLTTF